LGPGRESCQTTINNGGSVSRSQLRSPVRLPPCPALPSRMKET
jgi:hypothetical protein